MTIKNGAADQKQAIKQVSGQRYGARQGCHVVLLQAQDIALLVGEDELLLLAEVHIVVQGGEHGAAVGVQAVGFIMAD